MQKISKIILMLFVFVLFGHGGHAQDNSTVKPKISEKKQTSINQLGKLDSRIELLKKQLKIRELRKKIKDLGQEESDVQKKKIKKLQKVLERQSKQLKRQKIINKKRRKAMQQQKRDRMREDQEERRDQEKKKEGSQNKQARSYIMNSRVIAVHGFGEELNAEILTPDKGKVMVEKGENYGQLGDVIKITKDNVIVKKNGGRFIIPYVGQKSLSKDNKESRDERR